MLNGISGINQYKANKPVFGRVEACNSDGKTYYNVRRDDDDKIMLVVEVNPTKLNYPCKNPKLNSRFAFNIQEEPEEVAEKLDEAMNKENKCYLFLPHSSLAVRFEPLKKEVTHFIWYGDRVDPKIFTVPEHVNKDDYELTKSLRYKFCFLLKDNLFSSLTSRKIACGCNSDSVLPETEKDT